MEGGRHRLQALAGAADLDGLEHAPESLAGKHQQAVVGPDEQALLVRGAQGDGTSRMRPGAPHLRVDDRQVDAAGHELQGVA